jgi:hypothetical protein
MPIEAEAIRIHPEVNEIKLKKGGRDKIITYDYFDSQLMLIEQNIRNLNTYTFKQFKNDIFFLGRQAD